MIASASVIVALIPACLFIFMLVLIQMRNFCTNRTTNERFSRKKVTTRSMSSVSDATSERSESTGSSLLSAMTIERSEDIINEAGAAEDYSHTCFASCLNAKAMCCHTKMPSQNDIY